MQAQRLEVGSQAIAFYDSGGEGSAVLLVHTNSSSGLSFRRQLESPLGEEHRLVAMDLPGHGQSEPAAVPESTYTLPGYASIVLGVVEQLALAEAVFVGWGLGGGIVLEASAELRRTAGLMVVATPPMGNPPALFDAFRPHPATAYAMEADLTEEEIARFAAAFFRPDVTDVPEFFGADVRRTDGQARQILADSVVLGDYRDEIEVVTNLSVPLAVLHGEQDQIVYESYISALTMPTLWRGAVQIIPCAGHAPHWEQPDRFNALLKAFVEETANWQ